MSVIDAVMAGVKRYGGDPQAVAETLYEVAEYSDLQEEFCDANLDTTGIFKLCSKMKSRKLMKETKLTLRDKGFCSRQWEAFSTVGIRKSIFRACQHQVVTDVVYTCGRKHSIPKRKFRGGVVDTVAPPNPQGKMTANEGNETV
jgi:hypothetical protein